MPHATAPSPGLQALILCGPGVSLNTFTSNPKDFPKALVPIGNRPMIWYPLDWCYRMGVTDVALVTPPESAASLEAALAMNPALTSLPGPRPVILAPQDLTQTTGTGELVRSPEVQKFIKSDFVILPCDLISELDGNKIIQQWMTLNPLSVGGHGKRKGGMSVFYPTHGLEGISNKKDETDFLATVPIDPPAVPPPHGSLRSEVEEIVFNMPTDTLNDKLEEGKGLYRLRQSLMQKHGRVKLRMKHRDGHIYIFPKWVKDFVARNDGFDSISEDVLSSWAKARWQQGLAEKRHLPDVLTEKPTSTEDMEGSLMESENDPTILSSTKAANPVQSPSTSFASRVGAVTPVPQSVSVPPILAYVQPPPTPSSPEPLIRRVDTTAQLLSVSLYLAKQSSEHALSHEHKLHPTAIVEQQARVSQEDSLIAENVHLDFRSNVKESVIGANCEIGKNARITRCVLMEGVVVGDGVQLQGCIIGRRARIEGMKATGPAATPTEGPDGPKQRKKKGGEDEEERTKLTDCEVAPNFVVEAGTEAKGEKLMVFDTEGDMDDLDDLEDE